MIKIDGLASTLKKLNQMKNVSSNSNEILSQLCEIGAEEVRKAHEGTMAIDLATSGQPVQVTSDAVVTIEKVGNVHSIVATGYTFPFFEFGAGVKKNSPRNFENVLNIPVPGSISPIGQYGRGYGARQNWGYSKDGLRITTSGYQAKHGFANAINAIVANSDQVIKGVLK